jgi:hypothetical protein
MDSRFYLFQPSASVCDANFAFDILTTAINQPRLTACSTSMRSYTPISYISETTCSYDGISET